MRSGNCIILRSLVVLLLSVSYTYAIALSSPLATQDILKGAKVLIDEEGNRTVESLLSEPSLFETFEKEKIDLGYTTKEVWVRFTIENKTPDVLRPVLEIDNPNLDYIHLYEVEGSEVIKHRVKGVQLPLDFRGPLNFSFDLSMGPDTTRHYLLHVSSVTCALYFKANVMDHDTFFRKELKHQLILALFFGLIIGLIIYNVFIYYFSKDIAYVYYVGYQLFVILAYSSYVTISRHILAPWMISVDAFLSVFYLMGTMGFMLLFTREFLYLQRFRRIDLGIKTLGALGLIVLLLSSTCCFLIDAGAYLTLFASVYLLLVSLYLMAKRQPHARYFVVGWGVSLFGTISLMLYQMGLAPYMEVFPYLYESAVAFEAVLFSVVLAQRINYVKALARSLDTQKVLTRELHHRVKNNMQLIISLLQLRFADIKDKVVQQRLKESINNIIAMSKTHESLYTQKELDKLDTQEYFQQLLDTTRSSLGSDNVSFDLHAHTTLSPDHALHCGIILNELVTNCIKYAFEGREKGTIIIRLYEEEGHIHFEIKDDGIGFDKGKVTSGFGSMMVQALVSGELRGTVDVQSDKGTHYSIVWKK